MTHVETTGLEVNAQLTRWFVSFAEFSCFRCYALGYAANVIPRTDYGGALNSDSN